VTDSVTSDGSITFIENKLGKHNTSSYFPLALVKKLIFGYVYFSHWKEESTIGSREDAKMLLMKLFV
jgi:hypothetical protein